MRHIFRLFALMQRDGRNRIEIARRRVLSLFAPKLETEETPLADSGGRLPLEVERRRAKNASENGSQKVRLRLAVRPTESSSWGELGLLGAFHPAQLNHVCRRCSVQ